MFFLQGNAVISLPSQPYSKHLSCCATALLPTVPYQYDATQPGRPVAVMVKSTIIYMNIQHHSCPPTADAVPANLLANLLHRVLMVADISAYLIALLHITISVFRVADTAPGRSIFHIYLGPQHWLFNLGFITILYQASALLMLLAIASTAAAGPNSSSSEESFYTRHRHVLCLLSRLLRLFYSTAHLLLPGATLHFAQAIAARTQAVQQRPMKALLMNVLHPTAFWMAQVCCWLS
jgi:hypothetical protein